MPREDFLTFIDAGGERTARLPLDFAILVTDTLEAPGTFLLTQFISRSLREGRRTVLVGFSNTFDHYSAVVKKLGIQLTNETTKGRFTFVDATQTIEQDLNTLYQKIEAAVGDHDDQAPLLVLDDLSSVLWVGHEARQVAWLSSRVRSLVSRRKGSLIMLQHGDDLTAGNDSEEQYLFMKTLQQSDLWLQTTSLSSQVRGELSIHRGPALMDDLGIINRSGPTALQYKLEEAGPSFYKKGLGEFL